MSLRDASKIAALAYGRCVPRALRPQVPGGFYHVTARGVAGAPIVMDDSDRAGFVWLLHRVEDRREWRLHAYCLMTTHVHLVVETPIPNISRGLHWLFAVYAQRFNRRWGRFGHLFADRFWSRLIEDDEDYEEVCRYVLENPVKAGLCDDAADWHWSGGLIHGAVVRAPAGSDPGARPHVAGD